MNYNEVNQKAQTAMMDKERKRAGEAEELRNAEKKEDERFLEYVIKFIESDILELAEKVVKNDGNQVSKVIKVNKIVFGYPKSSYIINRFNRKGWEPVYQYLEYKQSKIEEHFAKKFPMFNVRLYTRINGGIIRGNHEIRVFMSYKNVQIRF